MDWVNGELAVTASMARVKESVALGTEREWTVPKRKFGGKGRVVGPG